MSLLKSLFGGGSGGDEARVVQGLQTILQRERDFDPATRAQFWQEHIGVCIRWHEKISKILLQSPDADAPDEAVLRMSQTRHIAGAQGFAAMLGELELALLGAGDWAPGTAASNPHCLRLCAFSNILDFARTSGRSVDNNKLQELYVASLKALGLPMEIQETQYAAAYAEHGKSPTFFITLSSSELDTLALAYSDSARVRGDNFQQGLFSLPPFMFALISEIGQWRERGGPQRVGLTELKREHLLRLLEDHVKLNNQAMKDQWPWDPRKRVVQAPADAQATLAKDEALLARLREPGE